MATEEHARSVENIIRYSFDPDRCLLLEALTAAGAVKHAWDGNRRLAQLGTALGEFLLVYLGYLVHNSIGNTTQFKVGLSSKEQRAAVASRTGIDDCIRYSEQSGAQSSAVRAKAVNAIIGAVFVHSGENLIATLNVMNRLGVFAVDNAINPALLTQSMSITNIEAFARSLVSDDPAVTGTTTKPLAKTKSSHMHQRPAPSATGSMLTGEHHVNGAALQSGSCLPPGLPLLEPRHMDQGSTYFFLDLGPRPRQDTASSRVDCSASPEDTIPQVTKRGAPEAPRTWKRQRLPEPGASIGFRDKALDKYLSDEVEKCVAQGYPVPQQTFLTQAIQAQLSVVGNTKPITFAKMVVYIASPATIDSLKHTLCHWRSQGRVNGSYRRPTRSIAESYSFVEKLGRGGPHFQVLRRCHVLELYRLSGGAETAGNGSIVVTTPGNFRMSARRPGNPAHFAEAEVSSRMMRAIFPDLRPDSNNYWTKYRTISDLRKLGRRLSILEQRFGVGVLGLMPNSNPGLPVDACVSDSMILKLTDALFRELVDLLDASQGALLRRFSQAVRATQEALLSGQPQDCRSFRLEHVATSDILRHPKGSPELLRLIEPAQGG